MEFSTDDDEKLPSNSQGKFIKSRNTTKRHATSDDLSAETIGSCDKVPCLDEVSPSYNQGKFTIRNRFECLSNSIGLIDKDEDSSDKSDTSNTPNNRKTEHTNRCADTQDDLITTQFSANVNHRLSIWLLKL